MLTPQHPTLSPNLSSVAKDLSVLITEVHFLGGVGKHNLSVYYLESPAQIKSEGSEQDHRGLAESKHRTGLKETIS